MNRVISVKQDLELLANLAAGLLTVPVVTITVYDRDNDEAGGHADYVEHLVIACDRDWAANHPNIDFMQLGCPRTAVMQPLGLYASMPLRNADGAIIGTVACAGDEARDLGTSELMVLKNVTALAAAVIAAAPASVIQTPKAVNFSA